MRMSETQDAPASAQNPNRAEPNLDTILIAEDDTMFRRILMTCLKKWGYRVMVAEDGFTAWNVLQSSDAPQMAIFNWMMPGIDGIELCRKVRNEQGRYRYLLLLTANDAKHDVVTGLDAGADDYLTKPFEVQELRARVRAGQRILELQDALLKTRDALRFEAAHDALTAIWNHGAVLGFLKRELDRQRRTHQPLGVIMADVDHFKKINDTHGHLVGDAVLREVARRLQGALRSYDFVGRYGGEEFLILVPGCGLADLIATAERLRRSMADHPVADGAVCIPVTISIGLVSAPESSGYARDCQELLRAADAALYVAKAEGRNRVAIAPARAEKACG
jgi:two-component system, cell cycle response regulator